MSAVRKFATSFFSQDLVNEDVACFSISNVWYYFFCETLICVFDLTTDQRYILDPATLPMPDNGFTNQHRISKVHIDAILNEGICQTPPIYMSFVDLSIKGVELGMAMFNDLMVKEMSGEHTKKD